MVYRYRSNRSNYRRPSRLWSRSPIYGNPAGYSFANHYGLTIGARWYKVANGVWRCSSDVSLELRYSRVYHNWALYRYGRFVEKGSFNSLITRY